MENYIDRRSLMRCLLPSLILLAGLIARYLFVFYLHKPADYLYIDMEGYFERAYHLHLGVKENIYDSFYPPATHYVYSLLFLTRNFFLSVQWFNCIVSTLTCLLVFSAARQLFDWRTGIIALLLCSFNYLYIDFSGFLMSETLFTFSLAFMFWAFIRSIVSNYVYKKRLYALLAGCLVIASAAVKSSVLLVIPLIGTWWVFNYKKYRIFFNLPFYALGFLPLFCALIIRFMILTGQFGIISTNGGFNFFQGRSHIKDAYFVDQERGTEYMFASPVAVQKGYAYNEKFYTGPYNSKFFYRIGLEEVRKNYSRTLKFSFQHLADLFINIAIWPSSATRKPFSVWIRIGNLLNFVLIVLPGILFVITRFRYLSSGPAILLTFPIAVIFITSVIYYGDPRFRLPFDIFFIMLAAGLYSDLYNLLLPYKSGVLSNQHIFFRAAGIFTTKIPNGLYRKE